jgi:hypothetical protein
MTSSISSSPNKSASASDIASLGCEDASKESNESSFASGFLNYETLS